MEIWEVFLDKDVLKDSKSGSKVCRENSFIRSVVLLISGLSIILICL